MIFQQKTVVDSTTFLQFFLITEPAIIKSLTLVINEVINTGIFLDKLKIAKVIAIFKNDDLTLLKKL